MSEKYEQILERNYKTLSQMIEICIKLKISVVEKDNSTTYGNITKEIADEILNSHIQNDIVLEKYIAK